MIVVIALFLFVGTCLFAWGSAVFVDGRVDCADERRLAARLGAARAHRRRQRRDRIVGIAIMLVGGLVWVAVILAIVW